MERICSLLLLLVSLWTTGYCRSSIDGVRCTDAASQCRRNRECRLALRSVDEKCKVLSGRCGAEMVNLPRCGKIMDTIFSLGFPQEPCLCTHENDHKCWSLRNKVYSHPCFASIRLLKERNLFPEEIKTVSKGNSDVTTQTSEAKTKHLDPKHDSFAQSSFVSKVVPTTTFPHLVKSNSHRGEESRFADRKDDAVTHKVAMTKKPKQIDVPNGEERLGSSIDVAEKDREIRKLEEKLLDYRLITIILGTMLGIFILAAVVFAACIRVRKTIFYTNGKVQVSNRKKNDGALSSRPAAGLPPRWKA